ncbi:PP2C family protein-serine/threonine phosphatase [Guggenheimella bovis]
MITEARKRTLTIIIYSLVALVYLGLSSSLLVNDVIDRIVSDKAFPIQLILDLLILILAASSTFVNLYSFAIFREARPLILGIASFLLTFTYFTQIVSGFATAIEIPYFGPDNVTQLSLIMALVILSLLLIKLALVHKNMRIKLPLRYVPVLLILITLWIFGVYNLIHATSKVNDVVVMAILMVLVFINLIGYLMKYLAENDLNAKYILFLGILHLATFMYPIYSNEVRPSQSLLISTFRVIGFLYVLTGFYKELFSSYTREVEDMNHQKDIYTNNLEQLIEERTKSLMEMNETLSNEINAAKELQRSMMPAREISYRTVSFISENFACERMSGDFFDIYEIDDDRVGMYILDVSGHGINAALINVYSYNYIRSSSPLIKRYMSDKPSRNLSHLYDEFNQMNFPDEMHMVIMIMTYDMKKGIFTYSNGGLNTLPILFRQNGDIIELDQSSGFPICKMGDVFKPEYTDVKLQLFKGDRILFSTDGLFDDRQPFSMTIQDIQEIFLEHTDSSLQTIDEEIKKRIEPYRHELIDDVSYFIMQVDS